jgi:hypothetical protein
MHNYGEDRCLKIEFLSNAHDLLLINNSTALLSKSWKLFGVAHVKDIVVLD